NRLVASHPDPNHSGLRMGLHTIEVNREMSDLEETVRNTLTPLLQSASAGQIVCSLPTASLLQSSLAPNFELRSLGPHRVEEREQAEPLLLALMESRAEANTLLPLSSSLPGSLTRFFGRQEEQTYLLERLRNRKTRLLTLKGPGGIGKTRLS